MGIKEKLKSVSGEKGGIGRVLDTGKKKAVAAGITVAVVIALAASVLLGHFVGSMVITSLALRIFYGYPWATLAVRIPNALILAAVNTVLLRILLENRTLMKMVKK